MNAYTQQGQIKRLGKGRCDNENKNKKQNKKKTTQKTKNKKKNNKKNNKKQTNKKNKTKKKQKKKTRRSDDIRTNTIRNNGSPNFLLLSSKLPNSMRLRIVFYPILSKALGVKHVIDIRHFCHLKPRLPAKQTYTSDLKW